MCLHALGSWSSLQVSVCRVCRVCRAAVFVEEEEGCRRQCQDS